MKPEVRLVAEVSSNHHSDLERCLRFVDAAADVGCFGVKFQQFEIERLFAPSALRFNPRLLERKAWELPLHFNGVLAERAAERGLAFASTPFHLEAVEALAPHVTFFKLASYQLLWHDMLRAVAATEKPVVLATGMATLAEVEDAVRVLRSANVRHLTLLHCVSSYPTPANQANLAAIDTLRTHFHLPVGWSDHTVCLDVVERAVQRFGARLVEFHFDLDGEGDEFRGGHCWLPADVEALRSRLSEENAQPRYHIADGDGEKSPRPCEREERPWRSDPSDGLRPLLAVRAKLMEVAS